MGDTEHSEAIGLWQIHEQVPVSDDGGRIANDAYTFRYDGDTVTLRLLTLRLGQAKSDDDFYRLEARWDGDMLSYRPPFGDWAELASFEGDHFEDIGSGVRRVFARIGDDEVAAFNQAILKNRPPYDYSTPPGDPDWTP